MVPSSVGGHVMTGRTQLSYSHGTAQQPLLGETIGANLKRIAAAFPGREALVDVPTGGRWTYAELDGDSDALARGLMATSLKAGDRVGIWAPNCAEWVLVQYATAKAAHGRAARHRLEAGRLCGSRASARARAPRVRVRSAAAHAAGTAHPVLALLPGGHGRTRVGAGPAGGGGRGCPLGPRRIRCRFRLRAAVVRSPDHGVGAARGLSRAAPAF